MEYDPNATPINIFDSPKSPEYAPYSPAPIDTEYDRNATPTNLFTSPKIKSPHTPDHPPPGKTHPILGGSHNSISSLINQIKDMNGVQQQNILQFIKTKKRENDSKKASIVLGGSTFFDAVENDPKTDEPDSENGTVGGTKKISF